jgi:uncharacterized protein (TIGR00255 family)
MIHSMTAFARQESHGDWGSAVWELRSVNHRYLELSLRLPETLTHLEPHLREQLKSQLQRGKIEIILHYQPSATLQKLAVNQDFALQLAHAHAEIAKLTNSSAALDPFHILRWPGVLQTTETALTQLEQILLKSFKQAVTELIALRQREGEALQKLLTQRLHGMQTEITKVKKQLPVIITAQREKLLHRFNEAKINLDPTRLEQEMVLFAQKIDVAEELDRLEAHIAEVQRTLQQNDANGRRLDFLLQELNREANTLGAKSVTPTTTLTAIELKLLIEQMREQVQNVE